MRSKLVALSLLTLAVGCEHKSKDNKAAPPSGSAAVKPDPVVKDPGGGKTAEPSTDQEVKAPAGDDLARYTKDLTGTGPLTATIETSMGAIHCELFADRAPITVANFVGLATGKKAWQNPLTGKTEVGKPYFDGLHFHRVIPDFMIQGGDPFSPSAEAADRVGTGGPGYSFNGEKAASDKFEVGMMAMANAGPGTDGSQFFITERATTELNGGYAIFGKCKEIDLVKQIARVPRDPRDKPNTPVTMKVTISKG
jgi:peptidyl-prolyl cis-trans isomerase A (cyclophilin A)